MASDAQIAANRASAEREAQTEGTVDKENEPLNPKSASFRAFIEGPAEPPLAT